MMNSLQTVSWWDDYFGKPRGSKLGLMSAIMSLGSVCSTPIASWVADKFGRRWGITTGSIMIIGAILQCESQNFAMFVVSRFILGFGLSFATTASPSMVSELSQPKDRVTISASIGITNKDTQALVNGLINIWSWLIALTTAFFVERIGRRPLFRISTVGMLIMFTAWTIASERFAVAGAKAAGTAVFALIFLYQIFHCIAFSPLPLANSVEVLPYSIRAKGMATYVFATKIAVFVNQFVNPIGLDNIGWRFYLVYVAVLAIESVIAYGWFLETKGKALEETVVRKS